MTECSKNHVLVYFAKEEDCPVCEQIGRTHRQDDEINSLVVTNNELSLCLRRVSKEYEELLKENQQ